MISRFSLKHKKESIGEPMFGTEVPDDGIFLDYYSLIDGSLTGVVIKRNLYWVFSSSSIGVMYHKVDSYHTGTDKRFLIPPKGAVITFIQD